MKFLRKIQPQYLLVADMAARGFYGWLGGSSSCNAGFDETSVSRRLEWSPIYNISLFFFKDF